MNDEKNIRIKLERHLWPDEIEQLEKQKQKKLKIIVIVLGLIVTFVFGVLVGIGKSKTSIISDDEKISKLSSMLEIMGNEWFFASDYDNVNDYLLDRAYYGMTSNPDVDLHTTYMSKEEVESFTQSINMNFVGIGVQFYNSGEYSVVKKVFKNSPADKAGVIAGDIFNKVDGKDVKKITSDELAKLVKGESGSLVEIEFLRQNTPITINIIRQEINATSYGEMIDDKIGYIEIYQFGESTAKEVKDYLTTMSENGLEKLVIDLRDNGGGYLDTLVNLLNYFLPKNTLVMQQEYSDGKVEFSKTSGGNFENIKEIVVLINENSASASEVMTLALKEQRSDVTIVGVKSYGKGTVQVTKPFNDGSAIKYTTSKWLSPNGVWINKKGIEPDVEVKKPDAISENYSSMNDDEVYVEDTVNEKIKSAQLALDFLGYSVDRKDGYFSTNFKEVLMQFQKDFSLNMSGALDSDTYKTIYSLLAKEWSLNKQRDVQYQKALEILND